MNNTTRGGEDFAGNPSGHFPHQPVLYHEVLDALSPTSGERYLDGTLGAGGHAQGILAASAPNGRLLGLDLDREALIIARKRLHSFGDRAVIRHASYRFAPELLNELQWESVQGILLDLGVSSMQIDQPERGFSFMKEGPLDMRFDQEADLSAKDLVNSLSEGQLAEILWEFGEERYARRIARDIVAARPIQNTVDLVKVIQQSVPGYADHIHPATRTFQALRIATNRELETLTGSLPLLVKCLSPGGRMSVISFHSLEDRIVKNFFRRESRDCICPPEQPVCTCDHIATLNIITKKPIRATSEEIRENPRSSSAKLRVAEKKSSA